MKVNIACLGALTYYTILLDIFHLTFSMSSENKLQSLLMNLVVINLDKFVVCDRLLRHVQHILILCPATCGS